MFRHGVPIPKPAAMPVVAFELPPRLVPQHFQLEDRVPHVSIEFILRLDEIASSWLPKEMQPFLLLCL